MTSAPKGLSKSDGENEDAKANSAAEKARAQRTEKEQKTVKQAIDKKDTTDAKAKVTTGGSRAENDALPKAEPEATSEPGDEQKPAKNDNATPTGEERREDDPAKEGEKQFNVPPAAPGPNDPVPEGEVQVTHRAEAGKPSDPSGNITEARKTSKRSTKKSDPLKDLKAFDKLPVAVTVGQVTASVEEYAGRPVVSLSLVGWVGDAPLKLLAADIGELEQALEEIRKELS